MDECAKGEEGGSAVGMGASSPLVGCGVGRVWEGGGGGEDTLEKSGLEGKNTLRVRGRCEASEGAMIVLVNIHIRSYKAYTESPRW